MDSSARSTMERLEEDVERSSVDMEEPTSTTSTAPRRSSATQVAGKATKSGPQGSKSGTGRSKKSRESENDGETFLSRCRVYCRLRPTNKNDGKDGGGGFIKLKGSQVVVQDERHYSFDGVFSADSSQLEVFDTVAVPCIHHAFAGFCSALMCYGQTGTGKSYTMCNTDSQNLGIIPRASKYIFEVIEKEREANPTRVYSVVGQFVQIYRDHLGDLMVLGGKERADIHFHDDTGVSLSGCTSHKLTSAKEFVRFYMEGNSRRATGSTAMNAESSRGHTAMMIWIKSEDSNNPMQGCLQGKITFIDLAGYERFSKTQITNADPIQKNEAKTINASLLALGHVVSSLSDGNRHIPWRNAKLTRILQDSIGGRSLTSIILTIGPSSDHLYETTNTLQFGLRAMSVKVETKALVTIDYKKLSEKLKGLLSERNERISTLEVELSNRDTAQNILLDSYQKRRSGLLVQFTKDLEGLLSSGASEEKVRNLFTVFLAELQNLDDQQVEEVEYQNEINSKEIANIIKRENHVNAKNLAKQRLAYEHDVEEYQLKLNAARGDANEDFVEAQNQLKEKDALLASCANEAAQLHAVIDGLTTKLKELGAEVPAVPELPKTFLHVSQVDCFLVAEQKKCEYYRKMATDFRTQLDRANLLVTENVKKVHRLQTSVENLLAKLQEAGVEVDLSSDELQQSQGRRVDMTDEDEIESLRLSMQPEGDELQNQCELKDELKQATEALRQEKAAHPRRLYGDHYVLSEILAADDGKSELDSTVRGDGRQGKIKQYRCFTAKLREQLVINSRYQATLHQQLCQANELLDTHGLLEQLPGRRGGNTNRANQGGGSDMQQQRSPRNGSSDELEVSPSPTVTETSSFLMNMKRDQQDTLNDFLAKYQGQVASEREAKDQYCKENAALRKQLEEVGISPVSIFPHYQPVQEVALEEFVRLLRVERSYTRDLFTRLMIATMEGPSGFPLSAEQRGQVFEAAEELSNLHTDSELRDSLLLEKESMLELVVELCRRLTCQVETLGFIPCCHLPESYHDIARVGDG